MVGSIADRLVGVLAEQKACATDQLGRLLGVAEAEVMVVVEKLRVEGLVGSERLLSGETPWVWLTPRGAAASGTGFRAHRPSRGGLSHLRQINEARLVVEAGDPGLEWVSERYLRREKGRRRSGFIPDGAVRTRGEVHAIEVELCRKPEAELDEKLFAAEAEYDVVVYFATREVARHMTRLRLSERHPRLVVRVIERPSPDLRRAEWRVAGDPPPGARRGGVVFEPSAYDVGVLDLLVEQGAIPMDQLGRFLGEGSEAVEGLIRCYLRAGLVRRAQPVPDEDPWVWVTLAGVGASSHECSEPRPRLGGLAMLRAVNEVRLSVHGREDLRWLSRRLMRREKGRRGRMPKAVIEVGGERHAVDVWLTNPKDFAKMEELLCEREAEHDAVVWFYSRGACARVEQFAAMSRSEKLVVRPLPGVDVGDLRPGAWRVDVGAERPESWGVGGKLRRPPRTETDELWDRLRKGGPSPMYRVAAESVPEGAMGVVAEVAGLARVRLTGAAWRRAGGNSMVFRLETDAGVYRVVRSRWGWRAAEVLDEGVFELIEGPMPVARRSRRGSGSRGTNREVTPPSRGLRDEDWEVVRELIPPIEDRPKVRCGRRPMPDRVMVEGMIFVLRSGMPLARMRQSRGYGTERTMRARIRRWEALGVWEPLCEELSRLLPDGRELDWESLRQ